MFLDLKLTKTNPIFFPECCENQHRTKYLNPGKNVKTSISKDEDYQDQEKMCSYSWESNRRQSLISTESFENMLPRRQIFVIP